MCVWSRFLLKIELLLVSTLRSKCWVGKVPSSTGRQLGSSPACKESIGFSQDWPRAGLVQNIGQAGSGTEMGVGTSWWLLMRNKMRGGSETLTSYGSDSLWLARHSSLLPQELKCRWVEAGQ